MHDEDAGPFARGTQQSGPGIGGARGDPHARSQKGDELLDRVLDRGRITLHRRKQDLLGEQCSPSYTVLRNAQVRRFMGLGERPPANAVMGYDQQIRLDERVQLAAPVRRDRLAGRPSVDQRETGPREPESLAAETLPRPPAAGRGQPDRKMGVGEADVHGSPRRCFGRHGAVG